MKSEQRSGPDRSRGAPRDVAEARAAVANSRARISATMDELEGKLVDTKVQLQDRLDVARPVRKAVAAAPLVAILAAAGAGLLLGLATGGRRREPEEIPLDEIDAETLRRWRRERRRRRLDFAEAELPAVAERPSRLARLVRDVVHEFAGAATAYVASRLLDRVKQGREKG